MLENSLNVEDLASVALTSRSFTIGSSLVRHRRERGQWTKVPLAHVLLLATAQIVGQRGQKGFCGVFFGTSVAVFPHGMLQAMRSTRVAVEEAVLAEVVPKAAETLVPGIHQEEYQQLRVQSAFRESVLPHADDVFHLAAAAARAVPDTPCADEPEVGGQPDLDGKQHGHNLASLGARALVQQGF